MKGLEYKIKLRRITESISNSNKILKWLLADKHQRLFYKLSRLAHALIVQFRRSDKLLYYHWCIIIQCYRRYVKNNLDCRVFQIMVKSYNIYVYIRLCLWFITGIHTYLFFKAGLETVWLYYILCEIKKWCLIFFNSLRYTKNIIEHRHYLYTYGRYGLHRSTIKVTLWMLLR